jgi:L,D-transpeptidase ErfK/SrfK
VSVTIQDHARMMPPAGRPRGGRALRVLGITLAIVVGVPLVVALLLVGLAGWETVTWRPLDAGVSPAAAGDAGQLSKDAKKLDDKLAALIPKGPYIVVNTVDNRLYLRDGDTLLRESVCSTGSYMSLEGPAGQKWFFSTPRGRFSVKSKQEDPVWIKPDWAFVEDGDPIPSRTAKERYEPGVLGLYALGFGNGYFIHGTLYTRLLGKNVTHGCVRLPDEDLEVVFKTAKVGTPIFIY